MSGEHEGLTSIRMDVEGPRAIGMVGEIEPAFAVELIQRGARLVAAFARTSSGPARETWRTFIFEAEGGGTWSVTLAREIGGYDDDRCWNDELVIWTCERSDAFGHCWPEGRVDDRLFPEPDGRIIRLA